MDNVVVRKIDPFHLGCSGLILSTTPTLLLILFLVLPKNPNLP